MSILFGKFPNWDFNLQNDKKSGNLSFFKNNDLTWIKKIHMFASLICEIYKYYIQRNFSYKKLFILPTRGPLLNLNKEWYYLKGLSKNLANTYNCIFLTSFRRTELILIMIYSRRG